jgi:hypothetical protein
MRQRIDIINGFIDENGYKSYLEIGLGDGKHFNAVKAEQKIGVDPEYGFESNVYGTTSDAFFEWYSKECSKDVGHKFDLIFIDGLHHANQVERDIVNSWKCLNKGGTILIHDIKPPSFESHIVPRKSKIWCGDVWRAWNGLKKRYGTLNLDYIDEEFGLGVIYKSRHKVEVGFLDTVTIWQEYNEAKGWKV